MNLIVLAFVIIACFWLAEILLLNFTSKSLSSQMLTSLGRDIIKDYEGYPSPAFEDRIKGIAEKNGLEITFFSADFDEQDEKKTVVETYVVYSVSAYSDGILNGKPLVWNDVQLAAFFDKHIFAGEREFTYTVNSPPTVVFGAEFTDSYGNSIFAYIESYRSSTNFQFNTTLIQLFVASIFCIVLAVVLALLYSRQFSEPIIGFSKAAEMLAKGKYDDIKFEKRGIAEIDSLAGSLIFAAREIKKTDEFRREFLANITHDLRTPITMMRGYAEMIRDISGENPQKRKAHSQIIIDESERLSLLVEDILFMSKLDSGTLKLNKTVFDISVIASTVVSRFRIKSITEGYKFTLNLDKNITVSADMQRIEQVFYNLIANAVTYAGDKKEIVVTVQKTEQNKCRVEIKDSGEGIPPDELALIWDRYYRVNQKARKVVGNGIGLNIVKGILDSHGASYGVESSESGISNDTDSGTTFWFEIDCDA